MTFSPVVTSTSLTKNKVIRSEELTEGSSSNRVHGSWFKIHQDSSGNISTSSGFIVININSFKLKIRISVISTSRIDSVFIRNNLPELGTDLVTALTSLNVDDLSHSCFEIQISYEKWKSTRYLNIKKITQSNSPYNESKCSNSPKSTLICTKIMCK